MSLQASVYDKETKAVFPELSANPGPGSSVHFRNGSIWCYDEPQLAELLLQYQGTPASSDGPSASSWMPWLIATCTSLGNTTLSPHMRYSDDFGCMPLNTNEALHHSTVYSMKCEAGTILLLREGRLPLYETAYTSFGLSGQCTTVLCTCATVDCRPVVPTV